MADSNQMTSDTRGAPFDIVVVGAGYVGLATAVSIATARPRVRGGNVAATQQEVV
jgi:UDP-N-acetyl-D-mannosaminuronate dehydrogenase